MTRNMVNWGLSTAIPWCIYQRNELIQNCQCLQNYFKLILKKNIRLICLGVPSTDSSLYFTTECEFSRTLQKFWCVGYYQIDKNNTRKIPVTSSRNIFKQTPSARTVCLKRIFSFLKAVMWILLPRRLEFLCKSALNPIQALIFSPLVRLLKRSIIANHPKPW